MEPEKSNELVKNSYILIVGYLVASLVSTIGTIITIRLISVEEYGLINIALILPVILISFGELGFNYASTNFIAKKIKENDINGIRNIIRINLVIKTIVGLIFTVSVAFLAFFIAKYIYNVDDERIPMLIQISSIAIISNMLYNALNACLLGAQKVRIVQIGTILLTSLRTIIGVALILLGYILLGPILGIVLSSSIVVIIYLIFLKFSFKKDKSKSDEKKWKEFKAMVKYGHPLLLFSLIVSIQSQVFILILTYYGFLDEVSYYNVAIVSAAIVSILIKGLSFTLFPIFSKFSWDKEDEKSALINYFKLSIKYGTFLILPVAIFVVLLSNKILPLLYGDAYRDASIFVSIYFLIFLLTSFGLLSIPAFFNGQGDTKLVFYFEIIFLITGVIFALLLISYIGSIGVVLGFVIGDIFAVVYGNIMIRKKFGKELFGDFKNIMAIFLIAIISGIFIVFLYYLFLILFPVQGYIINLSLLFISFIIYFGLFFLLIGFFSLVSDSEIDFFVRSFENFIVVNKLVHILAKIEKKIIKIGIKRK